jgi:ABC-2 type transport system ATP-binding protein
MLALSRPLLVDAKILFVDEPTRSLDPKAALKVQRFLRNELVERKKKTVFWATHNLAEATEFAHDIAILDRGRIKMCGSVSSLTSEGRRSLRELFEEAVGNEENRSASGFEDNIS